MRPPECAVCGKEDGCELLAFKQSTSDKNWEKRMKSMGGVGHPPWQEWFCEEHAENAKKFTNMTLKDAWPEMKKRFKTS
ncbi:hypothetical protein GF325_06445 [Candidatus Bathyarchaeota archaeon]|nr:hypothetical protein [Candidatus Bathyarchaeota archaeon]